VPKINKFTKKVKILSLILLSMNGGIDGNKRNFLKLLVTASIAASAGLSLGVVVKALAPPALGISSFPTLQIVDSAGNPVLASDLTVNNPSALQFNYPLQGTPNFLLNVGDQNGTPVQVSPTQVTIPATGTTYQSYGGVGKYGSIVAYSAICQHLGCIFPELRYYPAGIESITLKGQSYTGVLHCLCHGSTYDPTKGASVITGPTTHPLPMVKLVWDATTDELYVSNMTGPTIYGRSSDLVGESPIPGSTTELTNLGNPFTA
jgi:Rieske Fe-S protein